MTTKPDHDLPDAPKPPKPSHDLPGEKPDEFAKLALEARAALKDVSTEGAATPSKRYDTLKNLAAYALELATEVGVDVGKPEVEPH